MRVMSSLVLLLVAIGGAKAQSPEPPLSDTRLTVHTLLREDVFAGFMANDMVRFARAERNIEQLLKDRPDQRGNLLAWKGSAAMHRAVLAHESGNNGEFLKQLQAARAAFAEAAKQTSGNDGVAAITGGSYAVFADRLPEPHRATAWADAYANYSLLWKQQGSAIDKLPVHHRGEVLGGLVQSAQRTGRTEEMAAASRSHAHADEGHAVRGNGTAVEGESGECGDDQGDVQGLPQPGAFVVDARIVAEVTAGLR